MVVLPRVSKQADVSASELSGDEYEELVLP